MRGRRKVPAPARAGAVGTGSHAARDMAAVVLSRGTDAKREPTAPPMGERARGWGCGDQNKAVTEPMIEAIKDELGGHA